MAIEAQQWIETTWRVEADRVDLFLGEIEKTGSLGNFEKVPLDFEADFISGVAQETQARQLTVYFPVDADRRAIESIQAEGIELRSIEVIGQGDWATAWKAHFKPFHLTETIVIRPSWEPYEASGGERVITLDPGMAFGTGQHDSTRFCAEFLAHIRTHYPSHQSAIDVGCGSGILSLIAAKLGFAPVTGIDNDAIAIEVARENLERNPELLQYRSLSTFSSPWDKGRLGGVTPIEKYQHLADFSLKVTPPTPLLSQEGELKHALSELTGDLLPAIQFMHCDDALNTPILSTADIVVANIIAEVLCALKPALLRRLKPSGLLILSGILPERAAMIEQAFENLSLIQKRTSADWCAYLFQNS